MLSRPQDYLVLCVLILGIVPCEGVKLLYRRRIRNLQKCGLNSFRSDALERRLRGFTAFTWTLLADYSTVPSKVSERHSFRNNEKCNLTLSIYRGSVRIWGMLWSHLQAAIQKMTKRVSAFKCLLSAADLVIYPCVITKLNIKFKSNGCMYASTSEKALKALLCHVNKILTSKPKFHYDACDLPHKKCAKLMEFWVGQPFSHAPVVGKFPGILFGLFLRSST